MKNIILVIAAYSLLIPAVVHARGQGRGGRKGPPQEALAACQSKSAGEACEFTGRRGDVAGTCFTPEESKPLACRPSNRPRGKKSSRN